MPRCLPMLNSFSWLIFARFLLPTWITPNPKIIEIPEVFICVFDFRCFQNKMHLGSPLGANMASQNPPKNRSQDASIFLSILASIFYRFLIDLGGQLGAMLATFSSKMGGRGETPPHFLLGLCYFSIFWSSWTPLVPISARFWRVWASILEVFGLHFGGFWSRFGSHVPCNFNTFIKLFFFKASIGTLRCWVGGVTRSAKNLT